MNIYDQLKEDYSTIYRVIRSKKISKLKRVFYFLLEDILKLYHDVKDNMQAFFIGEKDGSVYLITYKNEHLDDVTPINLTSLDDFHKCEYEGFIYKKVSKLK